MGRGEAVYLAFATVPGYAIAGDEKKVFKGEAISREASAGRLDGGQ